MSNTLKAILLFLGSYIGSVIIAIVGAIAMLAGTPYRGCSSMAIALERAWIVVGVIFLLGLGIATLLSRQIDLSPKLRIGIPIGLAVLLLLTFFPIAFVLMILANC